MHSRIRAARMLEARRAIEAAATELANRFDLGSEAQAVMGAGHKDPELDMLFRLEAIRDLLRGLCERAVPQQPESEAAPAPEPKSRRKKE